MCVKISYYHCLRLQIMEYPKNKFISILRKNLTVVRNTFIRHLSGIFDSEEN